ncbi:MAG: hypothetical protein HC840_02510 [Leptolyngbyaceae cyanobacterium RM2_2_4]|nr:hypothetical protein [Leptolyngbyaceae cyanobacterium SM1_4_3]NJN90191.1 hypothetical protein [Leptolyngbyaceae cyanobacterium SL_5_14]NJO48531.1 hypothetical protein [Leptolyngbyaceae cyanobacterium RM2_2_4]NJO67050.1 hypothetical protein [Leptolyngbyaceae cyanobacterium RM1_405_57]
MTSRFSIDPSCHQTNRAVGTTTIAASAVANHQTRLNTEKLAAINTTRQTVKPIPRTAIIEKPLCQSGKPELPVPCYQAGAW